jgi:hypothetical protein
MINLIVMIDMPLDHYIVQYNQNEKGNYTDFATAKSKSSESMELRSHYAM